jgi:hypothetical protein
MSIYKNINPTDISTNAIEVYKTISLHSGSDGVNSVQFMSGSVNTISRSYWESARFNFYLSGSKGRGYNTFSESKYTNPYYSHAIYNPQNPQHVNKFHSTGSTISISQNHFGERIKKGSFKLTDNSTSKEIVIQDDSRGNLYAVNATITQSNSSISSSDNYVGNIFYNIGVVNITETGSYSASIGYPDVTTGNYTLQFKSTKAIYVTEYVVRVNPNEFNATTNLTARTLVSGSGLLWNTKLSSSPLVKNQLTASGWSPYITTIGLYDDSDNCVMVARYPQPIKTRDDIPLIFKIKMDL